MAVYQSKIGRIRIAPEAVFGVEESVGNFIDMPWLETVGATITLLRPVETPGHAQQMLDGYPIGVLMPKRAKIEITFNLETLTTKALSGVTPAVHWLGLLLRAFGFTSFLPTGTTVSGTGSSVNVVNFTSAASYRAGASYAVRNPTTGLFEIREIESISTNAVTNKMAHAAAPTTAGWDIMAGATYYLDPRPGQALPSLQAAVEGASPFDRWLVKGLVGESLSFEDLQPGGIPKVKMTLQAPMWLSADGSATVMDLVGEVLGLATYTNNITNVVKDSDLRFGTVTNATLPGMAHVSKIEFTPNIKIVEIPSPAGIETVAGYARVHEPPAIRGSLTLPFEDLSFFSARDSRTSHRVHYQISTAASVGGVLLSAPTIQVVDVQRADENGLQYQKVDWVGRHDEETVTAAAVGSSDHALAKSSLRLGFY